MANGELLNNLRTVEVEYQQPGTSSCAGKGHAGTQLFLAISLRQRLS
jgi:hypothetical protein